MARQHAYPDFPGVSNYEYKGEVRQRFRHKLIKEYTFKAAFGTDAFRAEYAAKVAEVDAASAGKAAPVPASAARIGLKTFRHAWVLLQGSLDWAGLKDATQRKNRDHIEAFLQTRILADADVLWGDAPLAEVEAEQLQDHYEGIYKTNPAKAKHRVEAIRKLYDVAVRAKPTAWIRREDNKIRFIDLSPLPESDANRPWLDEDRAQFEARWPLGTPPRTAYEIGLALGSRRGDLATLTPSHIKNRVEYSRDGSVLRRFRAIEWDAAKGRKGKKPTKIYHEVSARLDAALAALTHDMDPAKPFLRRPDGETYKGERLSSRMAEWTASAGMAVGFTLHGLRHSLGTDLAEQGLDLKQIQLALGHKNPNTTAHYVRRVSQERVMKKVAEVQNGGGEATVMKTVGNLKLVG
jgi:integrase